MATHKLAVRRAVLTALKNDAALSTLVPATRIYPPQTPATPAWPFIRYGQASAIPVRASCVNGSRVLVSVHAFARGPGEDAAEAIGDAVASALDGAVLTLPGGVKAHVSWTGGQTLRDTDEADDWHVIVDLAIEVIA